MTTKYKITQVDIHPFENGFTLRWWSDGYGFGTIVFDLTNPHQPVMDTECMSKEFVASVMARFLEQCIDKLDLTKV
jgi:hypothetical protein